MYERVRAYSCVCICVCVFVSEVPIAVFLVVQENGEGKDVSTVIDCLWFEYSFKENAGDGVADVHGPQKKRRGSGKKRGKASRIQTQLMSAGACVMHTSILDSLAQAEGDGRRFFGTHHTPPPAQ